MPDISVNFAPPAESLTTDERLTGLAQILATTVDRTNPPTINESSANDADSSLDILAVSAVVVTSCEPELERENEKKHNETSSKENRHWP